MGVAAKPRAMGGPCPGPHVGQARRLRGPLAVRADQSGRQPGELLPLLLRRAARAAQGQRPARPRHRRTRAQLRPRRARCRARRIAGDGTQDRARRLPPIPGRARRSGRTARARSAGRGRLRGGRHRLQQPRGDVSAAAAREQRRTAGRPRMAALAVRRSHAAPSVAPSPRRPRRRPLLRHAAAAFRTSMWHGARTDGRGGIRLDPPAAEDQAAHDGRGGTGAGLPPRRSRHARAAARRGRLGGRA